MIIFWIVLWIYVAMWFFAALAFFVEAVKLGVLKFARFFASKNSHKVVKPTFFK